LLFATFFISRTGRIDEKVHEISIKFPIGKFVPMGINVYTKYIPLGTKYGSQIEPHEHQIRLKTLQYVS